MKDKITFINALVDIPNEKGSGKVICTEEALKKQDGKIVEVNIEFDKGQTIGDAKVIYKPGKGLFANICLTPGQDEEIMKKLFPAPAYSIIKVKNKNDVRIVEDARLMYVGLTTKPVLKIPSLGEYSDNEIKKEEENENQEL